MRWNARLQSRWLALAIMCGVVLTRDAFERTMWSHMLLQIPIVVWAGARMTQAFVGARFRRWNVTGAPGLLLASATIACWMIPRLLDAAVESWWVDAGKFAMLLCAGAIARWSWANGTAIARVFTVGNAAWMTGTVGMLLLDAPTRLCVRYGANDQRVAGYAMLGVTLTVVVLAIVRVAFPVRMPLTAISAEPAQ